MNFRLGTWYKSKDQVRAHYRQYRKGILRRGGQLAIIFEYIGSRRQHYGDKLDLKRGVIHYVGEGLRGDQKPTAGNQALIDCVGTQRKVCVFLDCGDLFKPKRLLCAGTWRVAKKTYPRVKGRRVFRFSLQPLSDKARQLLRFTFGQSSGVDRSFEADLRKFGPARQQLYSQYPDIMRTHDNIAGEIGEYFAVKYLNRANPDQPVIRLGPSERDVDAIQIGNGRRFAIKTIGKPFQSTSNIWSKRPQDALDDFVIVHLDTDALRPRYVLQVSSRRALPYLKRDQYQGSLKLRVTPELARKGKLLYGKLPKA